MQLGDPSAQEWMPVTHRFERLLREYSIHIAR
jgi:hypothetical protein